MRLKECSAATKKVICPWEDDLDQRDNFCDSRIDPGPAMQSRSDVI